MEDIKDVFVSYGRAESKHFAARLVRKMREHGLNVWFDQNDIPLGVDFQNQIDDGIEKAHNFVFIIAPHSLKSEYCLKEVELAIKRNKRIIPILHIEPDSKEIWDMMHPVISKLNWVYFREKYNSAQPQDKWEVLDSFDDAFQGLMGVFQMHKEYVQKHTYFLQKALEWERHQKTSEYLLVGQERKDAEQWLIKEFKEQAPCLPTDLHCDYICEARKNGENMMTDVFISYATENRDIRDQINRSISRYNVTTWLHNKDIKKGEDYEQAINEGIEQADNFLYFLTKESIVSEYCLKELDYALKLNKRIIPLLIENISTKDIPKQISKIQYIDFTDNIKEEDYFQDIDEILKELRKDKRYYEQHKVFLAQALKWERQDKNPSILLRGYNLQNAQAWLKIGKKHKSHPPTALHEAFINESTAHSGEQSLEVFVSYSRTDGDFARKLNEELQLNGKTTWFDQESIAEGSDFQTEIYKGIELSDNFIFIISPDSVNSEYCVDEVEYASKLNKRFITLLYRDTEPNSMPTDLASVQWLDFKNKDFHSAFSLLIRTLDTDREHIQSHTKWQQRAMEWEAKDKDEALLLRGNEFTLSKAWFDEALDQQKKPPPTAIQREFLSQSEQSIFAAQRKEKQTIQKLRVFLVAAVLALILAVFGIYYAYNKNVEAQENLAKAEKAQTDAEESEKTALEALHSLEEKEKELQLALIDARASKDTAEIRQKEAELAKVSAQQSQKRAELALIQANEQKRKADLKARASLDAAVALQTQKVNPTLAMRIIERVYEREQSPSARQIMIDLYGNNDFYSSSINHNNYVYSTDISPDGNNIVSVNEYEARVFDKEGNEIGKINSDYNINKAKFSPDGNLIGLATGGTSATIWDWKANKKVFELPEHSGDITDISFSPDQSKIVTVTNGGYLYVWNSEGKAINNIQAHTNVIQAVDFSPDSKYVATGSEDKLAKIWEVSTLTPVILQGHNEKIMSVAFSPDGKKVLTGSWDRTSKLWSMKGDELQTYESDYAYEAIFSPDQSKVLTGGIGNDIKIFSVNGNLIKSLKGHKSPVRTLSISPDGTTVISGSEDQTMKVWKLLGSNLKVFSEHQDYVRAIAFSPDGKYMVSGSDDQTALLREVASGKVVKVLEGHTSDIMSVDFSVTGDTILTSEWGRKIYLWNLNGDTLKTYDLTTEHSEGIYTAKFSPDGKTFLTTSQDNTAKIWSIQRGTVRYTFGNHYELIYSADFSNDGEYLLTSSFDDNVKLWDISRQKEILNINTYRGDIFAVDLSPDGQKILVGGKTNNAHVYDINGNLLHVLKGHTTYVLNLSFSPDGKQMITVSGDNTAKLWTIDGQLIKTYKGHTQLIQGLAFTADGKMFATGSLDKQIRLWQTMPTPEDFLENDNIAEFDLHEYSAEGLTIPIEEYLAINDPDKLKKAAEVYHNKARNTELNDPIEIEAFESTALQLLRRAYANTIDNDSKQVLIDAHTKLGFIQLVNLKWNESEKNFNQAIELIRQGNYEYEIGSAYVGRFLCLLKKQNYAAMQKVYETSQNLTMENSQTFDFYFNQYLTILGEGQFSDKLLKKSKMLVLAPYDLLSENLITYQDALSYNNIDKLTSAAIFYSNLANTKGSEDYAYKLDNQKKVVELYKKVYDIDKKQSQEDEDYGSSTKFYYADAVGWISWYYLVNQDFEKAIENSEIALSLQPQSSTWTNSVIALAYLLQNKFDEFEKLEEKIKQTEYDYYSFQSFQDNILDYSNTLDEQGINHPNITKVRQRYMSKKELLEKGLLTKDEALNLSNSYELLDVASYYSSQSYSKAYDEYNFSTATELQKVAVQLYQKSYEADTAQGIWNLQAQLYSLVYYQTLNNKFDDALNTIDNALAISKTTYPELYTIKGANLVFKGDFKTFETTAAEYLSLHEVDVATFKLNVLSTISNLEYYGLKNDYIAQTKKDWQTVGQQLQEGVITYEEVLKLNDVKKLKEASDYYTSLYYEYATYQENFDNFKKAKDLLERAKSLNANYDSDLANVYWNLSWHQLLIQDYNGAEASVQRGQNLGAEQGILTNLGPSYLYQGMEKEALDFYNKWSTQSYENALFAKVFWEDLDLISPTTDGSYSLLENKIRLILVDAFTKDNNVDNLLNYANKIVAFISTTQGDYQKVKLYNKLVELNEAILKSKPSYFNTAAKHLGSYSWYLVNTRDFKKAIKTAKKGLSIDPKETWIYTNLALGYLFDDQYKEAEAIYLNWKDETYTNNDDYKNFDEAFLQDIKDLENKNITHPETEKIKKLLDGKE